MRSKTWRALSISLYHGGFRGDEHQYGRPAEVHHAARPHPGTSTRPLLSSTLVLFYHRNYKLHGNLCKPWEHFSQTTRSANSVIITLPLHFLKLKLSHFGQ
jgi:hypothetical protein